MSQDRQGEIVAEPPVRPPDLVGHLTARGHGRHEGHSVATFRDRFWLSLALTFPVLLWSPDPQAWLHYSAPTFPGSVLIPPVLGTVVFVYGGLVFLRGARTELADRQPGMMTLISLAMLVAFGTSWAGTLGLFTAEIWWELATLITIMLLIAKAPSCEPRRSSSSPVPTRWA